MKNHCVTARRQQPRDLHSTNFQYSLVSDLRLTAWLKESTSTRNVTRFPRIKFASSNSSINLSALALAPVSTGKREEPNAGEKQKQEIQKIQFRVVRSIITLNLC